jgi:hypothetical protein
VASARNDLGGLLRTFLARIDSPLRSNLALGGCRHGMAEVFPSGAAEFQYRIAQSVVIKRLRVVAYRIQEHLKEGLC